eukprot:68026-Rhodomonas_salina.1
MMIRMHSDDKTFAKDTSSGGAHVHTLSLNASETAMVSMGIDKFFNFEKFFFIGMKPADATSTDTVKREIVILRPNIEHNMLG